MVETLDWQTGNAWAGIRRIPVAGIFEPLLPPGGIQRGSVVAIDGESGAGVTSAALTLAAATTATGEWAAFVDPGSLGGKAALGLGVSLERCAVVRNVPVDRWAVTVGALLDGFTMVCAAVPGRIALGDARRLQARARQRQSIIVMLESIPGVRVGVWPGEVSIRIHVSLDDAGERSYDIAGKGISSLRLARAG